MSPLTPRNATLFAVAATIIAFASPASAFDFNKPADKRAYCQVYAKQALNDVRTGETSACGFTGISWSSDFNEQFNWCMAQSDLAATTEENLARSTAIEQCSSGEADFPPVIDNPQVQAAADPEFPPVVSEEPVSSESETPSVQPASFPPVTRSSAPAHTRRASFPVVSEAEEPAAEPDAGEISSSEDITDRGEGRGQEIVQRLVEFGQEHEDEIREAAQNFKEKIKSKLSDLKNHHDQDGDEVAGTLKEKIKLKLSGLKSHHGDHHDHAAGGLREKIKQKLSGLKERHGSHHAQAEHSLKAKVKNALKGGLLGRLANR